MAVNNKGPFLDGTYQTDWAHQIVLAQSIGRFETRIFEAVTRILIGEHGRHRLSCIHPNAEGRMEKRLVSSVVSPQRFPEFSTASVMTYFVMLLQNLANGTGVHLSKHFLAMALGITLFTHPRVFITGAQ